MKTVASRPFVIGGCAAFLLSGLLVFAFYLGSLDSNSPSETIPVWASASCESSGSVLSTGYFTDNVEALYYLDSQNARLSAALLSRNDPAFLKTYTRNIRNDLNEAIGKLKIASPSNPQFIMVSGDVDVRQFGAGEMNKVAKSLVYVAEINSGIVLVYALPDLGDRDLEISEGEIIFWTFARLNNGLNAAVAGEANPTEPRLNQRNPQQIDASFFNR